MMILARVVPLFSGSKGNSYYVGTAGEGVLIDAGKSCRQIVCAMELNGLDMSGVGAVFVTHEHADHCTALRVLAKKYGFRVYASAGTLEALASAGRLEPSAETAVIGKEAAVGNMLVQRIDTPHDAAESCCYRVVAADGRSALVATDMGVVLPSVHRAALESDFVVLESNHDVEMLRNGDYPFVLKKRILSDRGHLSNDACAAELSSLVEGGTLRLMLAHLSEHNNTPRLAMSASVSALSANGMKLGRDYTLDVAPAQACVKSVIF